MSDVTRILSAIEHGDPHAAGLALMEWAHKVSAGGTKNRREKRAGDCGRLRRRKG